MPFRPPPETRRQMDWLHELYGTDQTVLTVAVESLYNSKRSNMDTESIYSATTVVRIEWYANAESWWEHNVYGELAGDGQYIDREASASAYAAAVEATLRKTYPDAEITIHPTGYVPGLADTLLVNDTPGSALYDGVAGVIEGIGNDDWEVRRTFAIEACNVRDLTALDLRRYAGAAAHVTLEGQAQRLDVLYCPEDGRAGIANGADADWTDASSLEDAVRRYLGGGMQE